MISDDKYKRLRGFDAAPTARPSHGVPPHLHDDGLVSVPGPRTGPRQPHHPIAGPSRPRRIESPAPAPAPAAPHELIDEKKLWVRDVEAGAPGRRIPRRRLKPLLAFTLLLAYGLFLLGRSSPLPASALKKWKTASRNTKTNVILMISDGYGPAGETFARSFQAALHGHGANEPYAKPQPLPLDGLLIGTHRSRSSSSLITDSAAGATAFSCGLKSYNGAIGVKPDGSKCGTIFEAAKSQLAMLTGVVVTSRLTDATPAAFVSHVASRAEEPEIAAQEIFGTLRGRGKGKKTQRILDLAIGGGGCALLPQSHALSCRADDLDLLSEAQASGWHIQTGYQVNATAATAHAQVRAAASILKGEHGRGAAPHTPFDTISAAEFEAKQATLPWMGLVAPFNTPFEIDRIAIDAEKRPPSLAAMAKKALHLLDTDKANKKGFVLMIEGSQIDICAHSNDGACHAREILAYQEAIAEVRAFVERKNRMGERTLLISTSDHETGGLTLGRQLTAAYPNYAWYPERLTAATASAQSLSAELVSFVESGNRSEDDVNDFISRTVLARGAGFSDATGGAPTDDEVELVRKCLSGGATSTLEDPPIDTRDICRACIAETMSRRAEIGWSTSGHTGVDINVYGIGPGINDLRGNIENTDIGNFIAKYLHLDLAKVTREVV